MSRGAPKRVAAIPFAQKLRRSLLVLREESSFLREYLWKYRKLVAVGLFSLVVVDSLEIVPPLLLKESVDIAVEHRPWRLLLAVASGYLAVSVVQALGRYGWRMYLIRASMLSGRDLRNRYARHLFGLSSSFFERRSIGDLMSLATQDAEAVRMALGSGFLVMADALFYFLTVPVAMWFLSPKLTLLAFIPLPLIPWLVIRNERLIHERFERVQEAQGELSTLVQESLSGIRVARAFAKEDVFLERLREMGERFLQLNLGRARVQAAFGPTLDLAMSIGMVLLLYFGGRMMLSQSATALDAVTLGTFVAFQRYIQKMIWPMAATGMAINSYQRAVSASNRLKGVLAESPDVVDCARPELPAGFDVNRLQWRTSGGIELRDLRFAFPGARREVLCGVTLTIAPGERIAFLGAVGSGKSALLSLIPRLYPVADGMLFVDGVDVNRWPLAELRRQVGYVSQDVFLFSETVLENVAFGLIHERDSSGSNLEEAMRLASVHEDMSRLASSFKTRLGERGTGLSGGQRQRLTIARALARKPSILVLDDALSAVDVQTEEAILQGLRDRPQRNTEIIAAHRLSTIRDADRIVVLEAGVVRQMGSHTELARDRRGLYRAIYEQQRLREDLENYAEGGLELPESAPEVPHP